MSHYMQMWYPMVPKNNFFEKYQFWAFQRRVNHPHSHPRSKVSSHSMFMVFWYSIEFVKISLFRSKLWKILQILKGCKYATRLHNDMCDTAFESLDIIVFDMIIFGYYSGTQNTQNPTYVRHLK